MPEKDFDNVDDVQDQELIDDEELQDQDFKDEPTEDEQSKINKIIEDRLARHDRKTQKTLKELFGTSDLKTAAQYYKAGQAVAQASGKTPQEVLQRLAQQRQQQMGLNPQQQPAGDGVSKEIQEIKDILAVQRETEVREKESTEAKKEFGELYSKHEDDIQDMAEERGLSLVDAAAIVLRPHMSDLYSKRAQTKQEKVRKKRVEGSDESPGGKGVDPASVLSAAQKRAAQKMRLSYKDYYQQLKELGRID